MNKLVIHDWDIWQSYRKDRGTPPWIKVHRCLFSDAKWAMLSDKEKGHLVSVWIIAADKKGEIPADPAVIKKICMLDEEPNIDKFISMGLIDVICQNGDVMAASSGCHDDDIPTFE